MGPIRVLIAEGPTLVRAGIRVLLRGGRRPRGAGAGRGAPARGEPYLSPAVSSYVIDLGPEA